MSFYQDVLKYRRALGVGYEGEPRQATFDELDLFYSNMRAELDEYRRNPFESGGIKSLTNIVWRVLSHAGQLGLEFDLAWHRHKSTSGDPNLDDLEIVPAHDAIERESARLRELELTSKLRQQRWSLESKECPGCASAEIARLRHYEDLVERTLDDDGFWARVWYSHNGDVKRAFRERLNDSHQS